MLPSNKWHGFVFHIYLISTIMLSMWTPNSCHINQSRSNRYLISTDIISRTMILCYFLVLWKIKKNSSIYPKIFPYFCAQCTRTSAILALYCPKSSAIYTHITMLNFEVSFNMKLITKSFHPWLVRNKLAILESPYRGKLVRKKVPRALNFQRALNR